MRPIRISTKKTGFQTIQQVEYFFEINDIFDLRLPILE